ncbi:unnamed protein product [Notodromas monacha]|uniref:Uncharacterized protein n=1 Tax=Notodromas monacha TaxID=399045 RepID=A0A7R9BEZ0_9CRUS|nr:unnamed protein product [Notodromas monacha]CAG0913431.1 unnamed protein product [Notodromas monacha]
MTSKEMRFIEKIVVDRVYLRAARSPPRDCRYFTALDARPDPKSGPGPLDSHCTPCRVRAMKAAAGEEARKRKMLPSADIRSLLTKVREMEHRLGPPSSGSTFGRHSWMAGERTDARIVSNHGYEPTAGKLESCAPLSREPDVDKDKIISKLQSQVEEQVREMEHRLGPPSSGSTFGRHSWMAGERTDARIVRLVPMLGCRPFDLRTRGESGSDNSVDQLMLPTVETLKQTSSHQCPQRLLRLQDAKQVEAKAARIKEWVTNKLKDLEEQNAQLRLQNEKCNEQLSMLRGKLCNFSTMQSQASQGIRERVSTEDSSRGSYEGSRPESDESGAVCVLSKHPQPEPKSTAGPVYAEVDYQKKSGAAGQRRAGPPKVLLERKKFTDGGTVKLNAQRGSSTGSSPSDDLADKSRGSSESFSLSNAGENKSGESKVDSNSLDIETPTSLSPRSPHYSAPNAVPYPSISSDTEDLVAQGLQQCEEALRSLSNGTLGESLYHVPPLDRDSIASTSAARKPPATPTPPVPKPRVRPADEWHDYAEIYTPSGEKVPPWMAKTNGDISGKPPTPPLHRCPSWESRIYRVATSNEGFTLTGDGTTPSPTPSRSPSVPVPPTLGVAAPISVRLSCDVPPTPSKTKPNLALGRRDDGYCPLQIPVFATVKGRASQIRTMPFSGDDSESDSSEDGDDDGSAYAGGSEKLGVPSLTGSAGSGSGSGSGSLTGSSFSPSKPPSSIQQRASPVSFSPSHAGTSRLNRRENSVESGLSDDYALPPDAYFDSGPLSVESARRNSAVEMTPRKTSQYAGIMEKAGPLTKLSGKLRTWNKRWFVLKKEGVLSYWKSQVSYEPPEDEAFRERNSDNVSVMLPQSDLNKKPQGVIVLDENCRTPLGHFNLREARIQDIDQTSDSSEENEGPEMDGDNGKLTISVSPPHQGTTYLLFPTKAEKDQWLYHMTVLSGTSGVAGTQFEQLVQKLMDVDGDLNDSLWRHPMLLYSKEPITSPLTTLSTEMLQNEAVKLFKSCQLFMSVPVDSAGIDYHVVLAQNALQLCLDYPELQNEFICGLAKQTARHHTPKFSATLATSQVNKTLSKFKNSRDSNASLSYATVDSKANPPSFVYIQGWQLFSLAVSLFLPKNSKLLWYLKSHLSRNAENKSEIGKYACYCQRALERTAANGPRESKPSRMETLSILLKNPYHHSLPHSIPVHLANGSYQVVGFDGSTTVEEFLIRLCAEIGIRDPIHSGFALYSDDPLEKDLQHHLLASAKICDLISRWETCLREKGSGKFETTRAIRLHLKHRLTWASETKTETERERLLICYQVNEQIKHGLFPVSKNLALELTALLAQMECGDCDGERNRGSGLAPNKVLEKFFPIRYREGLSVEQIKLLFEDVIKRWRGLRGHGSIECMRAYLNCVRKWPFFGHGIFLAEVKGYEQMALWIAVGETGIFLLDFVTLKLMVSYEFSNVVTFGGCEDDFMLVVESESFHQIAVDGSMQTRKLLFSMSKPKILELTLLIADYMNAGGHVSSSSNTGTLTRHGSGRMSRRSAVPPTPKHCSQISGVSIDHDAGMKAAANRI